MGKIYKKKKQWGPKCINKKVKEGEMQIREIIALNKEEIFRNSKSVGRPRKEKKRD